MGLSNPNQLKGLRQREGMTNPEDIWDLTTYDEIESEVERASHNIEDLTDSRESTVEMERCIEKAYSFCNELSEDFRQTFLSLLEQYRNERRQMSQEIVDYLIEKNFVLPNFTITNGEPAKMLLQEYGLDKNIDEQNLVLVFNLPKPLAQFWWKGGADSWGSMSMDIGGQAIEWGHFYRELMPVVWETQGRYENEIGLYFQRINEVGEHDPEKYYYIWDISEWGH